MSKDTARRLLDRKDEAEAAVTIAGVRAWVCPCPHHTDELEAARAAAWAASEAYWAAIFPPPGGGTRPARPACEDERED